MSNRHAWWTSPGTGAVDLPTMIRAFGSRSAIVPVMTPWREERVDALLSALSDLGMAMCLVLRPAS